MLYYVAIIFLLTLSITPVQALMNDEIETLFYWEKSNLDIVLVSSPYTNKARIAEIQEVVTSTEFFMIEDNLMHKDRPGIKSPYYLGWQGALDNTNSTDMNLNFDISQGGGDIIISLTPQSSPYGSSGSMQPLFDRNGKITKVYVTIFNIDKISLNGLYTVTMHEMGHALGVGHSTAPEEVMHEKITTPYPYVSPCTMQALEFAYSTGSGIVTCLK